MKNADWTLGSCLLHRTSLKAYLKEIDPNQQLRIFANFYLLPNGDEK